MNELIEVREESGKQLVSARELYLGLGLNKSQWSRWSIGNIVKNTFFKEGVDYFSRELIIYGNPTKDYDITLGFSLHLISSCKTANSSIKLDILNSLGLKNNVDVLSSKEINFIEELEEVLKAMHLYGEKQFFVEKYNYRIDYYIPTLNLSIEYDENDHSHYSYEEHELRQQNIEKELKCTFCRVSDSESNLHNIGIIMNEVMKIIK